MKLKDYTATKNELDKKTEEGDKALALERVAQQIERRYSDTASRVEALWNAYQRLKAQKQTPSVSAGAGSASVGQEAKASTSLSPDVSAAQRSMDVAEFERQLERIKSSYTGPERIEKMLELYKSRRASIPRATLEKSEAQEQAARASLGLTAPSPAVTPSVAEARARVRAANTQPGLIPPPAGVTPPPASRPADEASAAFRRLLKEAQNEQLKKQLWAKAYGQLAAEQIPGGSVPPPPSAPDTVIPQEEEPASGTLPQAQPENVSALVSYFKSIGAIPEDAAYISSAYGEDRGDYLHTGVDVAAPAGTLMPAPAEGYVEIKELPGYGKAIIITNPDRPNVMWILGHVAKPLVENGTFVRKGQAVATPGTSGHVISATGEPSNATHIHYEVRLNGKPVDPLLYDPAIFAPLVPRLINILPEDRRKLYLSALQEAYNALQASTS